MRNNVNKSRFFFIAPVTIFLYLILLVANFKVIIAAETQDTSSQSISLGKRHIVILSSDNQFIWGSYYFAVINKNSSDTHYQASLLLPKEVSDFEAQSGAENHEITLDSSGKPSISKKFPPGLSLITIGFKVPHNPWNRNILTFNHNENVEELSITTAKKSLLTVSSAHKDFVDGLPHMLSPNDYNGILGFLRKHDSFLVTIDGIPLSRNLPNLIGGCLFVLLIMLTTIFTIKSQKDFERQ